MATQKMLRTYEGKKLRVTTTLDLNKFYKQIKITIPLQTCALISKLPSNLSYHYIREGCGAGTFLLKLGKIIYLVFRYLVFISYTFIFL